MEAYCLFVGYPRSGHSLVGSLLDAHPDAVIAHELDVMNLVRLHLPRSVIFGQILRREREFNASGREWTGYSYVVPGQSQGSYRRLRVIGDKKGEATTEALQRRPSLLADLRRIVGVPVRCVHVVRNPFDNIATMSRHSHPSLELAVDHYFSLCATVDRLRQELERNEFVEVHHEEVVRNPSETLERLLHSVGLEAPPGYLEDCSGIVFPTENRSRYGASWTPQLIDLVLERAAKYDFLASYEFEADDAPA